MKDEAKDKAQLIEELQEAKRQLAAFEADQSRPKSSGDEALGEGDSSYRQLFDNMAEGVAIYAAVGSGEDFVFVDYNKAGQLMDGVARDDAVGRKLTEVFPGIGEFGLLDVFQRVWKTGEPERHPVAFYQDGKLAFHRANYVYKLPGGQVVAVYMDETRRVQAEHDREVALRETQDRVKQLLGLYGVAGAVNDSKSLEELFGRACAVIPPAWRHPSITRSRVVFDGHVYASDPFEPTRWRVAADILVAGEVHGAIEVYYLEQPQELDEGLFLTEERDLIAALADMLGTAVSRIKVEEALLHASDEKYRLLAENATDVIWTMGMDFRFVYVSPSILQLRGYTVEEAMAHGLSETMSPESLSQVMELFAHRIQLAASGDDAAWDPIVFEVEQPCKDNTSIFTTNNAKLLKGPDGQPRLIVGVTHDTTERRRAEDELKSRLALEAQVGRISAELALLSVGQVDRGIEAALQTIAQHAGVVRGSVFICSDDLTSITNTHEWCADPADRQIEQLQDIPAELFGYYMLLLRRHENVVISSLEDLPVVEAASEREWSEEHGFRPLLFVPMISAGVLRGAIGIYGGVGQEKQWSDDFIALLRFVANTVLHVIERKRAEEEKITLEGQLRQAQKMEAVGRLAGGVAHDFNNVLCAITGNAELALLDLPSSDPLRELIEEIVTAAKRATDLTRQLLAFSRKQVIDPKVIDLSATIKNLHSMLVRLIGEDIILRTLPQKRLGRVRVDPGQIEQIVINLAVNARDAMPDGGELLIETADVVLDEDYCSRHAKATPGAYVMLTVSDTGSGMSAEVREKIFEPFFTTKQLGQGTGLGLATVFGIVDQSGGRIEVYSEEGEGSSFKVYFPRLSDKVEILSPSEAPVVAGGAETVLVVEDEEMVRKLAVKLLERCGYDVLAVGSGGDALVLAQRHDGPIDLLLTDVVMPHMNGRELAERFAEVRPGVKVLFTSGYTQNVIAPHGVLDEGMQFIAKPYSPETLAARVREVLDEE